MQAISFAPAILGALVVIQAGINRRIALNWGLPAAVLLNGMILTLLAASLFAVSTLKPTLLPPQLQTKEFWENFRGTNPAAIPLWYFLPGFIGLALVAGGPLAIARWGAAHTFVLLVAAQLFASLAWDLLVENQPPSTMRILGVACAALGAFLATR